MVVKVWVCAALALVAAWPATAATYENARFGYSVVYPENLLAPQPEAANGDGREFRSRSGRASFSVFAADDLDGTTPLSIERSAEDVCRGTPPALRLVKPRLVAMSCVHKGLIYYAKVLLENGVSTSLIAAYPIRERTVWDDVISTMARSLSPAVR